MPKQSTAQYLFRWLGRQVGHVRAGVRTEVAPKTVYRQTNVQQQPLPDHPNVTLRQTTINEVIVEQKEKADR